MKHIATSVLVLAVALAQAAERARPSREELERARRYREFAREVQFGRPAGAAVTYTNVDGMVLGLVLSATNILAGDTLPAAMIISNASQVTTALDLTSRQSRTDTQVGDFVVTTELGNLVPKVFRDPGDGLIRESGGLLGSMRPGAVISFTADLVLKRSLTNAGKYYVKAVAQVRSDYTWPESERISIAPPDLRPVLRRYTWPKSERMVIETPAVELTVSPRPEGSPAPPLYPDRVRSRLIQPGEEPPPHLVATHPKPTPPPARSRTPTPPK